MHVKLVTMKKEDIIFLPNKALRQKSKKIAVVSQETQKIVDDMISAAIDWENSRPHEISAALAAVQVDHLKRILIIRADFDNRENQEFVAIINPKIIKYEGEVIKDYEGCLSVKNVYGKVPRHSKIRITGLNVAGEPVKMKVAGFPARVLQHEVDHMDGVLFIDHIKNDPKAFYKLDVDGELKPLNYEKEIKNNETLWGHEDE